MPPEDSAPLTIADQLENALQQTGVSQSELARRLSSKTSSAASERRWLLKVLRGDVEAPEPESLAAIEHHLDLGDGYFVVPTAEQRRTRTIRLEELAAKQTEMDTELRSLLSRVEKLEDRFVSPEEREAQRAQRAAEEAERSGAAIPLERRPPAQDDQEQTA